MAYIRSTPASGLSTMSYKFYLVLIKVLPLPKNTPPSTTPTLYEKRKKIGQKNSSPIFHLIEFINGGDAQGMPDFF